MHQENLLTTTDIRQRHYHLAVETARAQQRGVEHIGTVRCSDHDHTRCPFEPIHLNQQLVQGLFALVIAAAEPRAALAPHCVDFVDENDARRLLLRLLEHVANTGRAHTDEHLNEIRSGNGEERHLRLTRNRARQQSLACSGRAHHQHALRDMPAQLLKLGRVLEEIDQFGNVLLCLFASCNIGEGHVIGGLVHHARARLSERKSTAPAAPLHLPHEKHPDTDQQQHREPGHEDVHQQRRLFFRLGLDLHAVLEQVGHQPDVTRRVAGDALAFVGGGLEHPALDEDLRNATGLHLFDEL